MSDRTEEVTALYEKASSNKSELKKLADSLMDDTRRNRQIASEVLLMVARDDPSSVAEFIPVFIEALNRPEAQTRWQCLDILTMMVEKDARACEKAIPGAETALFDEDSGPARLAAMKFLCKFGATTALRSEKTWPLIDEGIQCYHGDTEFNEMLTALTEFSAGKLSAQVKQELNDRMAFDAANGRGTLKKRALQILENTKA